MFGYVRPLPDELKVRDLRVWREDYCGLCRCLGKLSLIHISEPTRH